MQSCKPPPEPEYEDYGDYGDLGLKSGASSNTCSSGKVCCEPKVETRVVACQSMENHKCVPSNVS